MLRLIRISLAAMLAHGFAGCAAPTKAAPPAQAVRAPVRAPAPVRFAAKTEDAPIGREAFASEPTPDVRNSRDPDEVRRAIGRRRGRIQSCYRRALAKDPSLAGKLVLRWRVARTGIVSSTRIVSNTVKHRGLERCVKHQVSQLRFVQVRRGPADEIVFPFVFSPDQRR